VSEKIHGDPLVLHSDNGSPMKAATFQVLLEKLGIQSSCSRPRVSNDTRILNQFFEHLNIDQSSHTTDSNQLKKHVNGRQSLFIGTRMNISIVE
jgi:transposase InsO family protein